MTDYAAKKTALEEALLTGELTVESDGDRVTYRSTAEIQRAIEYCDRMLAAEQTPTPRPASTVAAYSPR